ncbi:MAG: urease accessory protein UreE [Steroidobacteraceae bacterium]
MLLISARLTEPRAAQLRLELPFEQRSRSRFRARLQSGEEVGVVLARGQILRGGDLLLASDGRVVEVGAASEWVSTLRASDARLLARLAYHLGNRHVALQIGEGWLRYSHDHVLDEMARGLGAELSVEQAPFEPEAGAYHGSDHGAAHGGDAAHGTDAAHDADAAHDGHHSGESGHSH